MFSPGRFFTQACIPVPPLILIAIWTHYWMTLSYVNPIGLPVCQTGQVFKVATFKPWRHWSYNYQSIPIRFSGRSGATPPASRWPCRTGQWIFCRRLHSGSPCWNRHRFTQWTFPESPSNFVYHRHRRYLGWAGFVRKPCYLSCEFEETWNVKLIIDFTQ